MPDSNWSIRVAALGASLLLALVALGIGAGIGASHTPNYGYQTTESANRRAQAEQAYPTQIDRDRPGLPYLAERVASAPDPSDGTEREKRDLAAQESMSIWAFWLLVVSAVGTVTTMIGTGFLLWQIILTREAVKDTGDATKAMVKQNELTANAQRPWLDFEIESVQANQHAERALLVVVKITNLSNFPAHSVRADGRGILHGRGLLSASLQPPDPDFQKLSILIGKGGTVFPRQPHTAYAMFELEDPTNALDLTNAPWGKMTIGIRYYFEGGVGYTYKTYSIQGAMAFIKAAKLPPQQDAYGETVEPRLLYYLDESSIVAT